jgi:hypothetical protein
MVLREQVGVVVVAVPMEVVVQVVMRAQAAPMEAVEQAVLMVHQERKALVELMVAVEVAAHRGQVGAVEQAA